MESLRGRRRLDETFHVINLDKRTDRWERISDQLRSRGLRTVRVKALEPPPESGRPGWLYCALSHIAILESARARGWPYVIVLEDDTLLSEHFDQGFPPVLGWLAAHPDLWDLFNGNPSDVSYVPEQPLQQIRAAPPLVRYLWGWMTNFMIYNRTSYDRVLALKDRYLHPTPEMLANYHDHAYDRMLCVAGLKTVTTLPYVSIQSRGFSDLEGREVDYDHWVMQNGQEFIRRRLGYPMVVGKQAFSAGTLLAEVVARLHDGGLRENPAEVAGSVDSFDRMPAGIRISGWALDRSAGSRAVTVLFFDAGKLIDSAQACGPRPDVVDALKLDPGGFRTIAFDLRLKEPLEACRLSALAVGRGGFSLLPPAHPPQAPPDARR